MKDTDFQEKPGSDTAGYRFDSSGLHVFAPVVSRDNELVGVTYIHANLNEMYSRLRQHLAIVAAVLLLASIVALLVSARLQRVISGPVLKLSQTARIVSE